jgi:MazG family protein
VRSHIKELNQRRPKARRNRHRSRRAGNPGKLFEELVVLQKRLRAPNGCPWDREQTHQTLLPFLVEEAYEVLDALDSNDAQKFAGELGDLLLQVVFHAELAKEAGKFDISDVIRGVHSKMVRRHPHVFGKVKARSSAQVLKNWEQIKAEERAGEPEKKEQVDSVLNGVPRGLPALLEGYQLSRRASNVGFDWKNAEGILEKIGEEVEEIRVELVKAQTASARNQGEVENEVGDLFFAIVNLARFASIDPERALKRANEKFKRRFQWMERKAHEQGSRLADVARAELEELWNESSVRA